MKNKIHSENPILIPYDDDNIDHVLSGPDYGQPWGEGWTEESTTDWHMDKWYKETVEGIDLENFTL